MNRRQFLQRSLAATAGATFGTNIVTLWGSDPRALAEHNHLFAPITPGSKPTLVVLELDGGADMLSLVAPSNDGAYIGARPTLALPADPLFYLGADVAGRDRYFNNTAGVADGLMSLWHNPEVGVGFVDMVGQTGEAEFSHFESFDNWWTATFEHAEPYGWLGRWNDYVNPTGTFAAIAVGDPKKALRGAVAPQLSLTNLDEFRFDPWEYMDDPSGGLDFQGWYARMGGSDTGARGIVSTALKNTFDAIGDVQGAASQPVTDYGGGYLGDRLEQIAKLIRYGIDCQIYYVSQSGYDTHDAQEGTLTTLLGNVDSAVTGFFTDLIAANVHHNVVLVTLSEFGRQLEENGDLGTDHGAANTHLYVGKRVAQGFRGAPQNFVDLHGNTGLKSQVDFRDHYAEMLKFLNPDTGARNAALKGDFAGIPGLIL